MSPSLQFQQHPHHLMLRVEPSLPLQPHPPPPYHTRGEVLPHLPRASSEPTVTEPSRHTRPYIVQPQPQLYHTGRNVSSPSESPYITRAGSDSIIIESNYARQESEPFTRRFHRASIGSEPPFREPRPSRLEIQSPREPRRARLGSESPFREPRRARVGSESPFREPRRARLGSESPREPYRPRVGSEPPISEPHHRAAQREERSSKSQTFPRDTTPSQLSLLREGQLQPYDPNLTCPMCSKQFRHGESQMFIRHTDQCTITL